MTTPAFINMYQQLIAEPSISALDPQLNMSNRSTITLLAN
ncbi:MAG: acetylornithine deacetylase, partial [Pseudoalteromonas marina]